MKRKGVQIRRLWVISVVSISAVSIAAIAMVHLLFAAGGAFAAENRAANLKEDELFVSAGGKDYVLKREDSSLWDRYVAEDDPTTVFWSVGKSAGLSVQGQECARYVLLRNLPDEDTFILTVDGRNYTMMPVISGSGAKYEAVGDPTTVFWSKGESAMLTIRGEDYPNYEAWVPERIICLTESADIK